TYRLAVHKAKWLHRLGSLAIALLVLFYFVPTATWILGVRIFVSGLEYWFAAIALTVILGFGTRAYYSGKLDRATAVEGEDTRVVVKKVVITAGTSGAGDGDVTGHDRLCAIHGAYLTYIVVSITRSTLP